MGASQRDDHGRNQVPGRVGQGNLRRRAGTEDLSGNDSGRRRLLAQLNTGSVAEVSRLDIVNLSRPRRLADQRMKRAPNEKECRALTLNRRRPSNSASNSNSNEASRLPQSITARDAGSRKVERRDNQKKRHRQVSNNFVAIKPAAPERENFGAAFFSTVFVVGRLYQTPTRDLFIICKTSLVWPLPPLRDQTSSNWILSNVVPLFVN